MVRARATMRRAGGKARLVGDLAADDAQTSQERETVWVDVDGVCGFVDEVSDSVVSEQGSPDFLANHLWRPRPQYASMVNVVELDLAQRQLEFPPVVVERGEFMRRGEIMVHHRSDEADDLIIAVPVGDAVLDDSTRDAGGFEHAQIAVGVATAAAGFLPYLTLNVATNQHRAVGPVGVGLEDRQVHVRADPEGYFGPGLAAAGPQVVGVEAAVSEDQHAGLDPVEQLRGESPFADPAGPDHGRHHRSRAALG